MIMEPNLGFNRMQRRGYPAKINRKCVNEDINQKCTVHKKIKCFSTILFQIFIITKKITLSGIPRIILMLYQILVC